MLRQPAKNRGFVSGNQPEADPCLPADRRLRWKKNKSHPAAIIRGEHPNFCANLLCTANPPRVLESALTSRAVSRPSGKPSRRPSLRGSGA